MRLYYVYGYLIYMQSYNTYLVVYVHNLNDICIYIYIYAFILNNRINNFDKKDYENSGLIDKT